MKLLADVQAQSDSRGRAIQKVGISDLRLPFSFRSLGKFDFSVQQTVGVWEAHVSLDAESRGIHMSRLTEVLSVMSGEQTIDSLSALCDEIRSRLEAENAFIAVKFPWFIEKQAPVSGAAGKLDLDVEIEITKGFQNKNVITAKVPATSLCPCSKSISEFGAHNQRSELVVSIQVKGCQSISIEELFFMAEKSASAELYSVVKRDDEKWITEQAYKNPKFVEDIVRDLANLLDCDSRIDWFHCSAKNFESIHNHNAYAEIESSAIKPI